MSAAAISLPKESSSQNKSALSLSLSSSSSSSTLANIRSKYRSSTAQSASSKPLPSLNPSLNSSSSSSLASFNSGSVAQLPNSSAHNSRSNHVFAKSSNLHKYTSLSHQSSFANSDDTHSLASTVSNHSSSNHTLSSTTESYQHQNKHRNHQHQNQNHHGRKQSIDKLLPDSNKSNLPIDLITPAYNLERVQTTMSYTEEFLENPVQYRAQLNLSQHEIDMVRYTWNKMLMEDKSNRPNRMPGQFPDLGFTPITETPNCSSVSLSLFCRQLYMNLLARDPELEKMFPSIKHQSISFAGVMTLIVSQLENLSVLQSYFTSLAKKHSRVLGIEPPQFELMGEALIQTFKERFGNQFTLELEILWIKVFLFLANSLMQMGIDPVLKPELVEFQLLHQQQLHQLQLHQLQQYQYQHQHEVQSLHKHASSLADMSDANSFVVNDADSFLTNATSISHVPINGSTLTKKTFPTKDAALQTIELKTEKKVKTSRFSKMKKKKKGENCVVV